MQSAKQFFCLLDADLWGFAFHHTMLDTAHRGKRIQRYDVALHQGVEKMPQGGNGLILRGCGAFQLPDIITR